MTKRIILSLAAAAIVAGSVSALTIQVMPGSLKNNKTELEYTRDASLVLTGSANVTDLALLKDMSRTITTLDMSGLEVVAYDYEVGDHFGQKQYEAGELPKAMLLGSAVETLLFPANTTKIGASAFASSALKSVVVPATVTAIGNNAWENCGALTDVRIQSETTLGTGVFKNCPALVSVRFDYDITSIPASTFDGDKAYTAALPSTVTTVGNYAMRGTALASLNLTNVVSVGDFAFAEMPNLAELTLNIETATQYGVGAFYGDAGLETTVSPGENVPSLLMAHGSKATQITVNAAVVGEGAYANNTSLTEVILGHAVRDIKAHAFRNDTNINTVNATLLGDNVPEVDPTAFAGLENDQNRYEAHLVVEKGNAEDWKQHPVWSLFDIMEGASNIGFVMPTAINVRVSRQGDSIMVDADNPIVSLAVYAVDGAVLYDGTPMSNSYTVNGINPAEVVVVKVAEGSAVKVLKLAPAN